VLWLFLFAMVVEAGESLRGKIALSPDVRWHASFGRRDDGEGHGTRLAQKARHQTTGERGKKVAP
jgi:hypothetical protein